MESKVSGPWPPPFERSARPSAGERLISSEGHRVSRKASVQILNTGLDDPLSPGHRHSISPGSEVSSPFAIAVQPIRSGIQSLGDASPTDNGLHGAAPADRRGAQPGMLVPPEPRMPRGKLLVSGPFRHQCEHMDRNTRDWNEEFQSLWEVECRLPWDIENRRNLEHLLADFDALAESLCMNVLQSELGPVQELSSTHADLNHQGSGNNRSFRKRSVKVLKHFTGCYRYGNLLIRRWRNADDGKAVQRSFQALFDVRVPHLAFPLTATHTYLGTVVTVQALVPMATSEGGGTNVVYRGDGLADPIMVRPVHHYVVRLLEALNLSPHDRGTQWKQMGLEILEGIDGRYYVTSALGLLPPLFPAQAQPTAHFRMDHMTSYAEPVHYMCGASLERFRDAIEDVCTAMPELFNDRHMEKPSASGLVVMASSRSTKRNRQKMLVDILHDRSINLALLGRVLRQWLASGDVGDLADDTDNMEQVTRLLCIEMIARTLKVLVVEKILANEETIDIECANRYLCRVVGSLPASHGAPAMSPVKESRTADTPRRREMLREMEAVGRFDEGLLPLICEKFQITEMRDMDALRKTFESESIALTKRLCQLLGLTMHRGAVVAIECVPHAHNFSIALNATRDLEQSRRFLDESRDDDRTEEVMISFILARRANIHCRSGAYDKALALQRRITSRRLRLGQRNFLYYDSLVDTALVAMRCKEEEAADALLQRVYEGYESIFSKSNSHRDVVGGGCGGSTHLSRAKIQLQIHWANFKIMQERYREARKRFSDALEMTRRLPTDNIPSSVVLNCLNGLLEVAGKSAAAQDVAALQPHVSLLVMRMKPSPRGLDTMRLMGSVLLEAGHHHIAAETLRDAMEMCGHVYGQVSEGMAILSNFLAFVYYQWNLQRYGSTCKDLLNTCQNILRNVRGLHSAGHLTAMNNLIRVMIDLREFTNASSQLHRLLRLSSSAKAVPGMSRQHPAYQALLSTREHLRSAYCDQAVLVVQQAWRGYQEKLLLQRIVGKQAALIQAIGRGFMSRQRLSGVHGNGLFGGALGQRSDTASRVFGSASSAPSFVTRRRDVPGGNNSGSTRHYHPNVHRATSPNNSRSMSPALSMRATTMRREVAASREVNPFVFGFSKSLLEASYDFNRHQRDWNGEMQVACEVIKATLGDEESVHYYVKRRDAVTKAFHEAAVHYAHILEETPSKAQRVGGSATAFRFENVLITRWPPDAVTPYVQCEAMRRVLAAGFPGITAPLMDVIACEGGRTYVAIALIPLPRSNVEYLRHEDLRAVLLSRRGHLHQAFLETLIRQITAVEPAPVLPTLGDSEMPSTTMLEEASMMSVSGADRQVMLSCASEEVGNPRGIEVVRGADDQWYVTNALGFFPTCIWRMESFDGVAKGPEAVLPHLPPPKPSAFEECRRCIAQNRPDDAVTLADEWLVNIQKGLHAHQSTGAVDHNAGEVQRPNRITTHKQELLLASYLKALVLEGCNRHKEASNAMRTLALSLEARDACSARAAQLWWIAGRASVHDQEYLDGSAMYGRAVQLVVKMPHHRRGMLPTVLMLLQSQFEAHLRNHDAGNNALPPIEVNTASVELMLRWVTVPEVRPGATTSSNGVMFPTDAHRLVAHLASKYFETRTMWDESIAYAQAASHSAKCLYGAASVEHAQALERLAHLFHRRSGVGDTSASIACLQTAIDTMCAVAPDSLDLGLMHSKMGAMHLHNFALTPAAHHLRQAHAMLSMRLRHDHQEMSTLRRNTRLLEMQLKIRAAVRVQSYMRGWLTRHRAEEALRYANPPAYRQLVATRYEKRQRQLMVAEGTGRILLADEEDTRMYEIERQGVVMRERARKQAIRRRMQDSYSGMLVDHCVLLWTEGAVPQEQLLRAGREQCALDMYAYSYPQYARRGLALAQSHAFRTHCQWLSGLRVERIEGAERCGRHAIEAQLYVRWATKCIVWHEQRMRRLMVHDAMCAKEGIGEAFAEGANALLGYTAHLANVVAALRDLQDALRCLPLTVEPEQRMLIVEEERLGRGALGEAAAHDVALRRAAASAAPVEPPYDAGPDEGMKAVTSTDDASGGAMPPSEQRRSIVAPIVVARLALDDLATSDSDIVRMAVPVPLPSEHEEDESGGSSAKSTKSSWSHVRVPFLSVTSPQNSRSADVPSRDNSLTTPKPLRPPTPEREACLMSPNGHGFGGVVASVIPLPPLQIPDGLPPHRGRSGSNTSLTKSPINQELASQRGRRPSRQTPLGASLGGFELPNGPADGDASNSSWSGTAPIAPHPPPIQRLSLDAQGTSPCYPDLTMAAPHVGDNAALGVGDVGAMVGRTPDGVVLPGSERGLFVRVHGTLSGSDPLSNLGGVSPLNRSGDTVVPPRSGLSGNVEPCAKTRCPQPSESGEDAALSIAVDHNTDARDVPYHAEGQPQHVPSYDSPSPSPYHSIDVDSEHPAAPPPSSHPNNAVPTLGTFDAMNCEVVAMKTVRPMLSASNLAKLSHMSSSGRRTPTNEVPIPPRSQHTGHPHRLLAVADGDDSDDSSSVWSALQQGTEGPAITPLKATSYIPPRVLDLPVSVLQTHLTARQQPHSGDESAFSDAMMVSVNTSPSISPHSNSHGNSQHHAIAQSLTFSEIVRRREIELDEASSWEEGLALHASTYGELLKMRLMEASRGVDDLRRGGAQQLSMDPTLNSELSKTRGKKKTQNKTDTQQRGTSSLGEPASIRRRVPAAPPHVRAQLVPRRPRNTAVPPPPQQRQTPTRRTTRSSQMLLRSFDAIATAETAARQHLLELQLLEWEPIEVWMSARWRRGSGGAPDTTFVPAHYSSGPTTALLAHVVLPATPSPARTAKTPHPRRSASTAHRQGGAPYTDTRQPKQPPLDGTLPSVEQLLRRASSHLQRAGK